MEIKVKIVLLKGEGVISTESFFCVSFLIVSITPFVLFYRSALYDTQQVKQQTAVQTNKSIASGNSRIMPRYFLLMSKKKNKKKSKSGYLFSMRIQFTIKIVSKDYYMWMKPKNVYN